MKVNRALAMAFAIPVAVVFSIQLPAVAEPDIGQHVAAAGDTDDASASDEYSDEYLASHPAGDLSSQQDAFGLFMADLDQTFPEDVIDRWWDKEGGTVVVHPGVVRSVEDLAVSVRAPVTVEASAADALTFTEVMDAERSALNASRRAGLDAVESSYDRKSRVVTVSLAPEVQATVTSPRVDRATVDRVAAQMPYSTSVEFRFADSISVTTAAIYGGKAYGSCTGGFTATRGALKGILTAHHCTTKPSSYSGNSTLLSYVPANAGNGSFDIRFTTTGGTATNKIWDSFGYKSMTGVGSMYGGLNISRYGKTSGWAMTVIDQTGQHCVHYESKQLLYCGMYHTVNSNLTQPGDSGGPWYSTVAYGLTSGHNSTGSWVVPVSAAVSSVSATVVTN